MPHLPCGSANLQGGQRAGRVVPHWASQASCTAARPAAPRRSRTPRAPLAAIAPNRYQSQGQQARIASGENGRQRQATLAHHHHGGKPNDRTPQINAGPTQTYANDPEGIAALTLELACQPEPIALAVYEPTGGYERPLTTALAEAGVPARRVHPNRVRAYARACGQQAKTDRLDAQVLSRYAAAFDLPPDPSPETDDAGLRAQLKDLLRRREQLVA